MSNWQQRYQSIMDMIYQVYDDEARPSDPDAARTVLALAAEIREGLDAGLLDADTVPPPPADRPDPRTTTGHAPDCACSYDTLGAVTVDQRCAALRGE